MEWLWLTFVCQFASYLRFNSTRRRSIGLGGNIWLVISPFDILQPYPPEVDLVKIPENRSSTCHLPMVGPSHLEPAWTWLNLAAELGLWRQVLNKERAVGPGKCGAARNFEASDPRGGRGTEEGDLTARGLRLHKLSKISTNGDVRHAISAMSKSECMWVFHLSGSRCSCSSMVLQLPIQSNWFWKLQAYLPKQSE